MKFALRIALAFLLVSNAPVFACTQPVSVCANGARGSKKFPWRNDFLQSSGGEWRAQKFDKIAPPGGFAYRLAATHIGAAQALQAVRVKLGGVTSVTPLSPPRGPGATGHLA